MGRGSFFPRWVLVFTIVGLAGACRGGEPVDTAGGNSVAPGGGNNTSGACAPGRATCPCDSAGSTAACGKTVSHYGNYVTCSTGQSTCTAGQWGPCVGNKLVTKSERGATLGPGGVHTLSMTVRCDLPDAAAYDPCDPNACRLTTSSASDVDADSVRAIGDGGAVTVKPSTPCTGVGCQVATDCPSAMPTTLTGTVRDPAGINPVYNASVYIPVDPALPALSTGASCASCAGAGDLIAASTALTGPDGTFVLTNVPSTDVAPGSPIPLVVQLGKWRREILLPRVPKCQSTMVPADSSRLPRNQQEGNLPKFAIATGASDPFECVLLKMGVDPGEFQLPQTGAGRVDFYVKNGLDLSSPAPKIATLVGDVRTLMTYDAVALPCPGPADLDPTGNYALDDQYADNISAYANAGGRLLVTHYAYTWLATPKVDSRTGALVASATNPATRNANPFFGVAQWALNDQFYSGAENTLIDTTLAGSPFPKGQALATWLQNIGGLQSTVLPDGGASVPTLSIDQPRRDVTAVLSPAIEWMHRQQAPNEPFYFSFDTPLGAAGGGSDGGGGACGRVDFSDFHASRTALVDSSKGGACFTDADCGFTATCNRGATFGTCTPLRCATSADCADGTYACSGAVQSQCVPQRCGQDSECATNQCRNGTCQCTQGSECKSGTCTGGTCAPSPQPCGGDRQCGRVEDCSSGSFGGCQKSCMVDSDCTAGELCSGGSCQGCRDDTFCRSGSCSGAKASTCSASSGTFPVACLHGPLSPQEAALEFMLLDLTSCLSPLAPAPSIATQSPPVFDQATFTEDFSFKQLSCPMGTRVVWRELDWESSVPDTSEIDFSAQTTSVLNDAGAPDYSSAMAVSLAMDTTGAPPPGAQVFIDTGAAPGTTGKFNLAMPPVVSGDYLRLTVTLKSTADHLAAPTLLEWQVKADCLPSE